VKITGVSEGIDIDFENVKAQLNGKNDIELDIACHSIFKAKFYSNTDGNIRVLKKDGSVTSIVRIKILIFFIFIFCIFFYIFFVGFRPRRLWNCR